MSDVKLALEAAALLGECPRWHAQEARLYWVDIERCELHRFDPATGIDEAMRFDTPVGCFAFMAGGSFMLAMKNGFARLNRWSGTLEPYGAQIFADKPDIRFNDGRTDGQGRFWAGSVNMAKSAQDAALYCLHNDGAVQMVEGGMLTCNGAAFDAQDRHFFHADTPSHAIRRYAYDSGVGQLGGCMTFHQFPFGEGRPDGGSVDSEGYYWSALFDGGRVVRLSGEGEIVQTVELPVSRPTMIAFGGEDLKTAYVTTARVGLDEEALAREPLAGAIFTFQLEVAGTAERNYIPAANKPV